MGSTNSNVDAQANSNRLQTDCPLPIPTDEKLKISSNDSEANAIIAVPTSGNRLPTNDCESLAISSRDSRTTATVAVPSGNKLSLHDRRELQKVSKYAESMKGEIKSSSDRMRDKGYLGLLWDSKVPEKDKKFYHFFALKSSNRTEVLAEIQKYMDFYQEMGDAVLKVKVYGEKGEENGEENPYMIIQEISEKLSEMYEKAATEQDFTPSSTLYKLHKSFIKKHEQAENLIKRVECVALKSGLRSATDGWQKSIKQVGELTETVKEMDKVCKKFEDFKLESDKLLQKCNTLEERSNNLAHHNELLMEKMQSVETMAQQNATLMEENKRMQQKQDDMMAFMQKIYEQQEALISKKPPPSDE